MDINVQLEGTFEEGQFLKGIAKIGETQYEGQIKDNHLHGKGVLTFKNNLQIEATFEKNLIKKDQSIMMVDLDSGEELRVLILRNKQSYFKTEKGVSY